METSSAARSGWLRATLGAETVLTASALRTAGWSDSAIRAQLAARRWQRVGRAVVLHNGQLSRDEQVDVAVLNCGPRAAPTAFTAAAQLGLNGWERDAIDVLVPAGARVRRVDGIPVRVHWVGDWHGQQLHRGVHALAPAVVLAAGSFTSPRPACGIVAAAVQQRLLRPDQLSTAIGRAPRLRHHRLITLAIADIAQGSESLSEIDLARLCRRHHLPLPLRQVVRVEPSGRRRYLDAEWIDDRGRRVVVEVDGALHLAPRRWWDDQLRQNELVIAGDVVLRFPSAIMRCEELVVADQLRRTLIH